MDARRFDNLARTLANRISRRGALRGAGAGVAASLLAASGIRPEQAAALMQAQNDGQPLYTLIRRYTLAVPTGQVRQALQKGYVDDACKAPGFVAYLTVEDEDGDFATVAVFRSQNDLQNFANVEANWIARNLGNLLPAPDETISGDTRVYASVRQGFPNTCPAAPAPTPPPAPTNAPAPPTAAPGQPTTAPARPTTPPAPPTAAPLDPTPTPLPACTGQGCVCATGTQSPCDAGLVCCPTTDLLGGPGVCQPESVCYPNACDANGRSCARSCGTTEACPSCCSNYCNGDGLCDDPPAPCTGDGCTCATGTQSPCDPGLVCCGVSGGAPGAPGTCRTEAECNTFCTTEGCTCSTGVNGACDNGLVCCGISGGIPGDNGTCRTEAECNTPCTGENCDCDNNDPASCDSGLVCCAVQAGYICVTEAQCSPPPCTSEGCDCIGGTQDACNDGLICCVQGDPGAPGICQTEANCPGSLCTSEGCDCNGGVQGACADGLVCCQPDGSLPGGPGVCQPSASCNAPTCTGNGAGCDATCNWGDSCGDCCSGYCNNAGVCDNEPPANTCIADGENCGVTCNWSDACDACCSGFCNGAGNCSEPGASAGACGDQNCGCELGNSACVDDLLCCDDGSGVTGTCQPTC